MTNFERKFKEYVNWFESLYDRVYLKQAEKK